jgi:SMC interacting uncharacterized protein involved in chromosome segregation
LEYSRFESKNEIETQKDRVQKIRIVVDSLTNEVVAHLNKINRLLTEIEQDGHIERTGH